MFIYAILIALFLSLIAFIVLILMHLAFSPKSSYRKFKKILLTKLPWDSDYMDELLKTLPVFLLDCRNQAETRLRVNEFSRLIELLRAVENYSRALKGYDESIYRKELRRITLIKILIYKTAIAIKDSYYVSTFSSAINNIERIITDDANRYEKELIQYHDTKKLKTRFNKLYETVQKKIEIVNRYNPVGNSYLKYLNRQKDIFNGIVHSYSDEPLRTSLINRVINNLQTLEEKLDSKIQGFPAFESTTHIEKLLEVEEKYLESIEKSHYENYL